jgi:hypothetical protein
MDIVKVPILKGIGKDSDPRESKEGRFVFKEPVSVLCRSSLSSCLVIEKGRGNRPGEALATLFPQGREGATFYPVRLMVAGKITWQSGVSSCTFPKRNILLNTFS